MRNGILINDWEAFKVAMLGTFGIVETLTLQKEEPEAIERKLETKNGSSNSMFPINTTK